MSNSRNIILTGFMGTGKTQVGRQVAWVLGRPFIDIDHEIERKSGKPIHQLFKEHGEKAFRDIERDLIRETCRGTRKVIATGGGAMLDQNSRQTMLGSGFVVCLEALPQTIYKRLEPELINCNKTPVRPLLVGPEPLKLIQSLKSKRQQFYAKTHWIVQTDQLTVEQTVREVIRACNILSSLDLHQDDLAVQDREERAATVIHSNGSYPILVGWELLHKLGDRLTGMGLNGPAYIISDDNVFNIYGRIAQRSLQRSRIEAHCFIVPAGEQSKNLELAKAIYEWLTQRRAERGHVLIAVGGGMIGDLAGYVAATFLRGLPFVQVPTSMAAMVDAAIGGKVAVNLKEGKNLVGAFYQPTSVIADVKALQTLGKRELSEGWAEAIKHGLVLDASLFEIFEQNAERLMALEQECTLKVIRRSMAIKAHIVSKDERETLGQRILLNYGHTIGHALEAVTGYGHYLHGEAVAIGMMGAAYISQEMGLIGPEVVDRQRRLLQRFNLPTYATDVEPTAVLESISLDKKIQDRSVNWVLLDEIGKAITRRDIPKELVARTVRGLIR